MSNKPPKKQNWNAILRQEPDDTKAHVAASQHMSDSEHRKVYSLSHELSPQAVTCLVNEIKDTQACLDVLVERVRQNLKWGEQNWDPQTYLSILMEEVGEAAREANDARWPRADAKRGALDRFRTEMVQVAAVALAMVECLDRGKWQWPTP